MSSSVERSLALLVPDRFAVSRSPVAVPAAVGLGDFDAMFKRYDQIFKTFLKHFLAVNFENQCTAFLIIYRYEIVIC